MELRVLQYFLAVAREQSISAAAESLHLSQPTLSTQLKALEEQLGKQLLIRGTKGSRKVLLTEEGMDRLCAYYDAARAKGATVCVSYAPTNASADTSPSVLEAGAAFDNKWRAMLAERGYSLISDYRRHIYPGRFFHDSDYHMNPMGAILHTDQLLADLEAAGVVKLSVGRQ